MSKLFLTLTIVIIGFVVLAFLIPDSRSRTVPIRNTINNTIAALHRPAAWRSLDSGKNTRIRQDRSMSYSIIEPVGKDKETRIGLIITPDLSPAHNINTASITYFHPTRLIYRIFPFLEKSSADDQAVHELRSYLEDNNRFYGYPISTQKLVDSFFLTRKQDISARALFSSLPSVFKELQEYASNRSCKVLAQNISIVPLANDSISLMAGLNIDKQIDGDYIYNFRQLPSTLGLVVGRYQGPFVQRQGIYTAIERFLSDHALAKIGLPYERYDSGLPVSDSSIIDINLIYPVTYR